MSPRLQFSLNGTETPKPFTTPKYHVEIWIFIDNSRLRKFSRLNKIIFLTQKDLFLEWKSSLMHRNGFPWHWNSFIYIEMAWWVIWKHTCHTRCLVSIFSACLIVGGWRLTPFSIIILQLLSAFSSVFVDQSIYITQVHAIFITKNEEIQFLYYDTIKINKLTNK